MNTWRKVTLQEEITSGDNKDQRIYKSEPIMPHHGEGPNPGASGEFHPRLDCKAKPPTHPSSNLQYLIKVAVKSADRGHNTTAPPSAAEHTFSQLDALAAQRAGSTLLCEPSVHAVAVKSVPTFQYPKLVA